MEDQVVLIFLVALAGVSLTLGAWFVRDLSRAQVTTRFGRWTRAEAPGAYWFWAVYHVVGFASFILALAAVTLYFVAGALAQPAGQGDGLYLMHDERYYRDMYPHAYAGDVMLRAEMTGPAGPRGEASSLTGIEAVRGGYRIFVLEGARMSGPPVPNGVTKFTGSDKRICDTPLDGALALRLTHAWKAMLDRARPSRRGDIGLDGEFYMFSAPSSRIMGGTWSPPETSPAGLLAGIAGAMKSYCKYKDAASLAAIEQELGALEKKL